MRFAYEVLSIYDQVRLHDQVRCMLLPSICVSSADIFSLHLVLSGQLFHSADSSMLILVKKCMKNERMKSREEDDRDAEALSYDLQKNAKHEYFN